MTTDFRALCADLVDIITAHANPDDYAVGYVAGVLTRARAALADGPAVPEGREPASVVGQPSDEAWDALVERAWDKYQTVGYQGERFMYDRDFGNALEFVRQGLARWGNPAPQPPAEGEVAELVRMLTGIAYWRRRGRPGEGDPSSFDKRQADRLDRAAEVLQRLSPPQPVPVSERLPGPGDCLDEGWAWFFSPRVGWRQAVLPVSAAYTHWLPAHALPLPEVK